MLNVKDDNTSIKFRSAKRPAQSNDKNGNTIVIVGVNPKVETQKIEEFLDCKAQRLVSSKTGGLTWKVKVTFATKDEKDKALKYGVCLGLEHFKTVAYTRANLPIMCYKCNDYGHIANS